MAAPSALDGRCTFGVLSVEMHSDDRAAAPRQRGAASSERVLESVAGRKAGLSSGCIDVAERAAAIRDLVSILSRPFVRLHPIAGINNLLKAMWFQSSAGPSSGCI